MLKKLFIFVGIMLLLISGAVILFGADLDFSDLYWGTAYKRILVLRDDTALTGLNSTAPYEPERVYDGGFINATPFSLSTRIMRFFEGYQLQFRDGNMFIHSDGATSLTIDGNATLNLVGTVVKVTGDLLPVADGTHDLGSTILEWQDLWVDGTAYLDAAVIGGGTMTGSSITNSTGSFLTLSASLATSLDGGTFTYNESGADLDFRFEGDGDANLLFGDAGNDRIGIGTAAPSHTLDVNGTLEVTGASTLTGAVTSAGGFVGDLTGDVTGDITSAGTSAFATTNYSAAATFDHSIEMAGTFKANGNHICLEGVDTYWYSSADNTANLTIGTVNEITIDNDGICPSSDGGTALGKDGTLEWSDVATQDLHVSDDLEVIDDATIGGILQVIGNSTFSNDLRIMGGLNVDADIESSGLYADDGIPQSLDSPGAINATTAVTQITSTGAADAVTIANGTIEGQTKYVYMIVDGGSADLAGANFIGTSLSFTDDGSGATLKWDNTNSKWYCVGESGCTYTP